MKLMSKFDSAKAVYDAPDHEIISAIGPKLSDRKRLVDKDLTKAAEILDFCKKYDVGTLAYSDERYPKLLKTISTPPVLLYYRGRLPDFNSGLYVAVVGTRDLSEYGRRNAFNFGYDLATAGATIVSGMAKGIDGVATAGAIASGHSTVAVLGSGIDVCYPPEHLTLAREIVRSGCIMTEYPPGARPSKYSFPKRNRIISGLCPVTLVIEGNERSGALITARYAKDQGRDIFALPGNVGAEQSEATNLLLKNGAKTATSAEDILTAYQDKYPESINLFMLNDRRPVDMMYVLRMLEVVANCSSDDIYNQPWIVKRNRKYVPVKTVEEDDDDKDCNVTFDGRLKVAANVPLDKNGRPKPKRNSCVINAEKSYGEKVLDEFSARYFAKIDAEADALAKKREEARQAREAKVREMGLNFDFDSLPGYKKTVISDSGVPAHFENGRAGTEDINNYNFDTDTLALYKKVPIGGAIEIEELISDTMPLRVVMKHLTKLESCKFIVVLPGGKVIRKY